MDWTVQVLRGEKLGITAPARLLVSTCLSLATFVALIPFARLDFDRHHDGHVLALAIAVRDGLSMYSDLFTAYGPVTTWLQSWALALPLGPALSLRILNSALIAITVFLIADIGRNHPRSSPLTYHVGVFAALAWVLVADVWLGMTMHPWSSTLVATQSLLFLYLVSRARASGLRGRSRSASVLSVLAGCSLGSMLFTRLSPGIPTIVAAVVGLYFIDRATDRPMRQQLPYVLMGTAIGAMSAIARLIAEGSLVDYAYQTIRAPLVFGSESGATALSRQLDFAMFLLSPQVIPVGVVLVVLAVHLGHRQGWRTKVPLSIGAVTILAGMIVVVVQIRGILLDAPENEWWKYLTSANFIFQYGTSPNYGYLYFFFALTLVAGVAVVGIVIFRRIRGNLSPLRFGYWILLAGLALAGASSVYPMWDSRHVWWGAPFGLLLVASLFGAAGSLWQPFRNPLLIPLLAVATMAAFAGTNFLLQPRTPSPASWVTSGMELPELTFLQMAEDTDLIRRYAGGDGQKAVFLTVNGDLSILLGKYQSVDRYFFGLSNPDQVNLGPIPPLGDRLKGSPVVFVRASDESNIRPDVLKALQSYQLVANTGSLMVYVPTAPAAVPVDER